MRPSHAPCRPSALLTAAPQLLSAPPFTQLFLPTTPHCQCQQHRLQRSLDAHQQGRLGQTIAGPSSCWIFALFKQPLYSQFFRLIHCFGLNSATNGNSHQALHCRLRHRRVVLNHQISNTIALNFTRTCPTYFRLILLLIRRSGHMHHHGMVAIAITQRVRTSCAHSVRTTK